MPQDLSLVITIILLAFNDIVQTIKRLVTTNLFRDDFNKLCISKNIKAVQNFLQKKC